MLSTSVCKTFFCTPSANASLLQFLILNKRTQIKLINKGNKSISKGQIALLILYLMQFEI